MSDQHVTGTPCNLIPSLPVCYYQTVTSCVQDETLIHDSQWTTMRWRKTNLLGEFQNQVAKKPLDNSNVGVCWLAVCLEFPNPDELRSTMFCCCPCLHFSSGMLNWESCHTKQGHLHSSTSIDWLGWHSNSPCRRNLGHSQFLVMWANCDITTNFFLIGETA
jgi:hypothetical protein